MNKNLETSPVSNVGKLPIRCFSSVVVFSRSVVADSLQPHGRQHARLPCPSPSLRLCSNSCPLSQWYHPIISSFVLLLLSSIFPSIRVFSSESVLHLKWPKYWNFSTCPSSEYLPFCEYLLKFTDLEFAAIQDRLMQGKIVTQSCLTSALWNVAHQAPQSMEFSRQEYWSVLPFPSPGDLPSPGMEPVSLTSPALAARFFNH